MAADFKMDTSEMDLGGIDVSDRDTDLDWWEDLIKAKLEEGPGEPIVNLYDHDRDFDAIYIGGGASGRFGSAVLRGLGGRQLMIDSWPFLGGSCPHQACVPHHLFSDLAAEMDLLRNMQGNLVFPEMDDKTVSLVDLVDQFQEGRNDPHAIMNYQSKEQLDLEFVLNIEAEVEGPHTVRVNGEKFHTRNLIIATGAAVNRADIPGNDLNGVHDYVTLVEDIERDPEKIVVIGGGKTAVEYGSAFQTYGYPTTLVCRNNLFRGSGNLVLDEQIADYTKDMMKDAGMRILENTTAKKIHGDAAGWASGVTIEYEDGSEEQLDCDMVFMATGESHRSEPYASTLGLETGENGEIVVDNHFRTNVDHVYAVGDVTGHPHEMWKARQSGVTAAHNVMGNDKTLNTDEFPDFLHTNYEVTWMGLREEEANEKYGEENVVCLQMPPGNPPNWECGLPAAERTMLYAFYGPQKKSGFQKALYHTESRKLLGVHHVGYGAKEGFQYLEELMKNGITIDEMADLNELFLNPNHCIQLARLRSGLEKLTDL